MIERDEDEHVDWHTVEQYVSNRLDPAIVSEITDHFAICTPCRGMLTQSIRKKLDQSEDQPRDASAFDGAIPSQVDLSGYRIVRRIAEGGMGTVYEAEQLVTGRPVALKFISNTKVASLGFGPSAEGVLQEVRAMGALSHRNIIQVIDVIVYRDAPVIVMEYFPGVTLLDWCREQRPSRKEIARLMALVGDAVAHAHERGVVHCDLKPHNILVRGEKEDMELKVIDFGVAKLHRNSSDSFQGVDAGTLAYMAPERTVARDGSVDVFPEIAPSSDIYSLGVILHELLVGKRPFAATDRESLLKSIQRGEPKSLRHFDSKISRDLDEICLKCMQKDPAQRYRTAASFASDLRAYFGNQPIQARRMGIAERLWKWSYRHPGVAGVAGVSIPLLAFFGVDAMTTKEHNRQLESVLKERSKETERTLERVEMVEGITREELRARMEESSDRLYGATPEKEDKEYKILEENMKRWQTFAKVVGEDEKSLSIRAESLWRIGAIDGMLGRNAQAEEEINKACEEYQALCDRFENNSEYQHYYASALYELAKLMFHRGQNADATKTFDAALLRVDQALERSNRDARIALTASRIRRDYGTILSRVQELELGKEQFHRAIAVLDSSTWDADTDLEYRQQRCVCECKLANVLRLQGLHLEAREILLHAVEAARSLLDRYPDKTEAWRALGVGLQALGSNYIDMGKWREACDALSGSLEQQQKIVGAYPKYPEMQLDYAAAYGSLGVAYLQLREFPEASENFERAEEIYRLLAERYPNRPGYTSYWINTLSNQLGLMTLQERLGEAISIGRRLVAAREELRSRFPDSPEFAYGVAASQNLFGQLLTRSGYSTEAYDVLIQAKLSYEQLIQEHPQVLAHRTGLAKVHLSFAELAYKEQRWESSCDYYSQLIYALHHLSSNGRPVSSLGGDYALLLSGYLGQATCYHRLGETQNEARCLLLALDALIPAKVTNLKVRDEIVQRAVELVGNDLHASLTQDLTDQLRDRLVRLQVELKLPSVN
jgi:tetratricopeptide (TPR) repeat protein